MKVEKRSQTTTTEVYKLDAQDILSFLEGRGVDLGPGVESIEVSVWVPGGGDWSHTPLVVGVDATVDVVICRVDGECT